MGATGYPEVTVVDDQDRVVGSAPFERLYAEGLRHRVIRVFIVNDQGQLLLQKRSWQVVIPNTWDQSVGGHVDAGEEYLDAAIRETREEMGVTAAPEDFQMIADFPTTRDDDYGKTRRFNRLYRLSHNGPVRFEPTEVAKVCWVGLDELQQWMAATPADFTLDMPEVLRIYLGSLK